MTVAELEAKIAELSDREKSRLAQKLLRHLGTQYAGIAKSADVGGGEACIAGTRIAVWVLEQYRRLGWSEAQLLENYPDLRAADLANAWAYTEQNPDEIDRAIRANEEA